MRITTKIPELLQLRRKLRLYPVSCHLLFQRRPAEIYGEMLDHSLKELKIPTLLLQTTGDDPEAMVLIHTYAALVPGA